MLKFIVRYCHLIPIIFCLPAAFSSCEYLPADEAATTVIDVPEPPLVELDMDDLPDTIGLYHFTDYYFIFNAGGLRMLDYEVTLDDHFLFHETQGSLFHFAINPDEFGNGVYNLRIKIDVASGSNSLADRLDAEGYEYTWDLTVIIDLDPPEKMSIKSIGLEDGRLKVSWEKYPRFNFNKYTLVKRIIAFDGSTYYDPYVIITDQDTTTYYHDNFVGGEVEFRLDITARDREVQGDYSTYKDDNLPSFLNFSLTDDYKIIFTWKRCKFDRSFSNYSIQIWTPGFPQETLYETSDINDTSWVYEDSQFGWENTYVLYTVPNNGAYNNLSLSEYAIGEQFTRFTKIGRHSDMLYIACYDTLKKFNMSTGKYEGSAGIGINPLSNNLDLTFSLSGDGNFLVAACRDKIHVLDPDNMEIVSTITTSTLSPTTYYVYSLAVNNEGLLAIILHFPYDDFNMEQYILYDLTQHTITDTLPNSPTVWSLGFSPDGNYLYESRSLNSSRIAIISNKQVSDSILFTSDPDYLIFMNNSTVLTTGTNYARIYALSGNNLSLLSEFTSSEPIYSPSYDETSNCLGVYHPFSSDRFLVYSLDDWSLKDEVEIIGSNELYCYLANATLFFSRGNYLKLNYAD
jgi:hypothetical protein